jgi:hypothetical protein
MHMLSSLMKLIPIASEVVISFVLNSIPNLSNIKLYKGMLDLRKPKGNKPPQYSKRRTAEKILNEVNNHSKIKKKKDAKYANDLG